MTTLTTTEFASLLQQQKGAVILTIEAETDVALRKDCPFSGVRKIAKVNGVVGDEGTYERSMQRHDSEFHVGKTWGEHNGKIVEHKGNLYLQIQPKATVQSRYVTSSGEVPEEILKPYFYARKEGGPVKVRRYNLSSIRSVNMLGNSFTIVQPGE